MDSKPIVLVSDITFNQTMKQLRFIKLDNFTELVIGDSDGCPVTGAFTVRKTLI